MKKLITAVAVASACLAPQAFAQSKSFEGFSLGASANFSNMKMEAAGLGLSDNSTTLGVRAAYGWAMSNTFNLTVGVSYDTGRNKVWSGGGAEAYGQDATVWSIAPGYKMSDNALIYAKVGYATVKAVASVSGLGSGSENYAGTAYGVGVRGMLNKNWSADFEYLQSDYGTKSGVKASGATTAIGINYHF